MLQRFWCYIVDYNNYKWKVKTTCCILHIISRVTKHLQTWVKSNSMPITTVEQWEGVHTKSLPLVTTNNHQWLKSHKFVYFAINTSFWYRNRSGKCNKNKWKFPTKLLLSKKTQADILRTCMNSCHLQFVMHGLKL